MIAVTELCVRLGAFALEGLSFEVPGGCYGVLMGRTGSGKTTILEAICGLRPLAGGRIELMGRDVTRAKAAERGIGYVPQEGVLFQTMTVREHLAFALVIRKKPPAEIDSRVAELSELLGLEHLLDRLPPGLSGGESQRVALGRALAARPRILCLDEPLSALDDETREQMYGLLQEVQAREGVTTLHVTHSLSEANRLADKLLELKDGRITARELQEKA